MVGKSHPAHAQLLEESQAELEAAGIDSTGPAGTLRTRGLALVWLATLRAWLADDDPRAGAVEQAVLWMLGDRMRATNETIAELLAATATLEATRFTEPMRTSPTA